MKKVIGLLVIVLFLFGCKDEPKFYETTSREKLVEVLKNSTGATNSYWENPDILVLVFSQDKIDRYVSNHIEQFGNDRSKDQIYNLVAKDYANTGLTLTKMKTCVKIMNEDGQEFAFECKE